MKHKWMRLVLACALFAGLLGGCGAASGKEEEKTSEEKTATQKTTTQKTTTPKAGSTSEKGSKSLPLPVFFEGQDMEGNEVSSDIFSETKLTMVNVWATYCSPCLNEMPDLGELAGEYEESDFRLIGIISDVPEGGEQEMIDLAEELIDQTGADYPHLLLNESLYTSLLQDVTAVPTTFFFNDKGMLLDTLVGSRDKDAWKEVIDGLLENL